MTDKSKIYNNDMSSKKEFLKKYSTIFSHFYISETCNTFMNVDIFCLVQETEKKNKHFNNLKSQTKFNIFPLFCLLYYIKKKNLSMNHIRSVKKISYLFDIKTKLPSYLHFT